VVLIVDDDPGIVILVSTMVKRLNCTVLSAHSGMEALSVYEQSAPDIILLDLAMPGMNGLEVFREIRRREEAGTRQTPILFLTAHVQTYYASRIDVEPDGYLAKPVTVDKLRTALTPFFSE
jgi:CheY-like chemotaxis protein